ncbi:type II toxin-antitoxin system VapB family antitoxin [Thiocapsa roseopersicina]|uniref:Antitoxin VapB n=1 Tax=Thiocapsa roseopersicina TaxID=1058 RepID=A0A1H3B3P1_THIRO|nr:type II toxin-antitoxin system VapB family antitoxin [Thiocapsa roseopersicina]SDX36298.1 antitoxin VapB [Thiocapsa roseopersicina]
MTGSQAYIDDVDFNIAVIAMPLQIANPAVVGKVERLARVTGLSKTAAVERAVDQLLRELEGAAEPAACMRALLAQLDRIPDRADAFDPLPWGEAGLPE